MNNSICYPKPLFIIILFKRKQENYSQKNEVLFVKHTTPITVIRIIAAKNENEPDERGFISGCLV
jgi:hypothetical protein